MKQPKFPRLQLMLMILWIVLLGCAALVVETFRKRTEKHA